MHTYYDAIFLSPHLDDAALSCGGQIAERTARGERVLIVTVMAGEPPATGEPATAVSAFVRLLHERWNLGDETVAARRAEDQAACVILGADWLHLDLLDCIYRTDASGDAYYTSNPALFGPVAPDDLQQQLPELGAAFAALPAAGVVISPLAVGNHVDHQLVRAAAEETFGSALQYYEDYPYMRIPGARDLVLAPDAVEWQARVIPLSPTAVQAKVDAIAAFKSQVGSFFANHADLEQQIAAFTSQTGGERIWQRVVTAVGSGKA